MSTGTTTDLGDVYAEVYAYQHVVDTGPAVRFSLIDPHHDFVTMTLSQAQTVGASLLAAV